MKKQVRRKEKNLDRKQLVFLFFFFFVFLFGVYFLYNNLSFPRVTGAGVTGTATLYILGPLEINITYPLENQVFNFNIWEPYAVNLNATSNFAPNSWWYDLYETTPGYEKLIRNSLWVPNDTFQAVRWNNS